MNEYLGMGAESHGQSRPEVTHVTGVSGTDVRWGRQAAPLLHMISDPGPEGSLRGPGFRVCKNLTWIPPVCACLAGPGTRASSPCRTIVTVSVDACTCERLFPGCLRLLRCCHSPPGPKAGAQLLSHTATSAGTCNPVLVSSHSPRNESKNNLQAPASWREQTH